MFNTPLLPLFVNFMLIYGFKSLHIEIHVLFLNEKVLTVHNVLLGVVILYSL